MIKIVCPECGVFFKPHQNGVIAEEWFMHDSEVYAIWSCDVLECPGCGKKVLAGFPDTSIAHHYNPKFDDALLLVQKAADQGKLYEIYEKPRIKK